MKIIIAKIIDYIRNVFLSNIFFNVRKGNVKRMLRFPDATVQLI